MKAVYKVNVNLDIPIYQQLVDSICAAIKNGTLSHGEQLPTVQEMVEKVGVARGTVKRAYDELERIGFVEKVQGRGTFVKHKQLSSVSRKEQAMIAIDRMLDELEKMGFSENEISIYLDLKLRERSVEAPNVKVAVVECNPENLSQMAEQMRHIDELNLFSFTFDSVCEYPYKLSEDFDLIVTTPEHSEFLRSVVSDDKRVARVALRLSARCLSQIIKLSPGEKIGILGYSERFAELLHEACTMYAEDVDLCELAIADTNTDCGKYLKGKDVVLVPKKYEKYFTEHTVKVLSKFKGRVVECNYEMDEGSVLYLETKIKKIRDEKNI